MEIYKDLTSPVSKEFEKLLNSKFSKTQIEEEKLLTEKLIKLQINLFFYSLKV